MLRFSGIVGESCKKKLCSHFISSSPAFPGRPHLNKSNVVRNSKKPHKTNLHVYKGKSGISMVENRFDIQTG